MPFAAFAVWLVLWRVKFSSMENVFGLAGLALVVFAVAVWQLGPDWGELLHDAAHPAVPAGEGLPTYWYYAIALFGAAMTPYEVFFFSSGGVEEKWSRKDLTHGAGERVPRVPARRPAVASIMACAALVLLPRGIEVSTLGQVGLPVAVAFGKVGIALALVGFVAATFGAACETGLSVGYSVAQFYGWQWGKFVRSGPGEPGSTC